MKALAPAEREAFAALAARVVVSGHFAESAEPNLTLFAVDFFAEGEKRRLDLHDAFAECASSPAGSRAEVLTAWVKSLLGQPHGESWKDVRGRLLPVLRNAWFGGGSLVSLPVDFPDLGAFLTLGGGIYVHEGDLRAWGLSGQSAFSAALLNLGLERAKEEPTKEGFTAIRVEGAESSSLLLRPDWLRSQEGRLVAGPSRDSLYVRPPELADSSFAARMLEAWDTAAQPVSPVLQSGGPPFLDEGRERDTERRARLALRAETYACQARVLAFRHPGLEIPAAVHVRSSGFLYCAWPEGREALLPDVTQVILRPASKRGPREIFWGNLPNMLGSTYFTQEPGLAPPRWRARAWLEKDLADYDPAEASSRVEELPPVEDEWEESYDSSEDSNPGENEDYGGDSPAEEDGEDEEDEVERKPLPLAEVRAALETDSSSSASHACRMLEALIGAGQLELSSRASLRALETEVADLLEQGGTDWEAAARRISARLVEMPAVSELFLDDAALAAVLARTAPTAPGSRAADPVMARARVLVRDLLTSGGAEPVRGGSREDVIHAVAEIMAARGNASAEKLAVAIHAALDQMDEDIVILTDASGLSRLLGR